MTTESASRREFVLKAAVTYGYITLWIFLSAFVIMTNKYILGYTTFSYPVALTLFHMAFCSVLAAVIVKGGFVEAAIMDNATYFRNVVPIAALFSGTLWLGNAAYMYLSVSFIQMIKAQMPVTVFLVSCLLGTERFTWRFAVNLLVVAVGVAAASYGEINFNMIGFLIQQGSIITETFRLCLIQMLLQANGIKLNPVTTLYYIAPACFVFLCVPFAFLELPKMLRSPYGVGDIPMRWLLMSATGAFALNMAVFLLIGKTSALTMNVAGVIKDWMLIALSVAMFGSPVSQLQLIGYGVAFGGVCYYNYLKMTQPAPPSAPAQAVDMEKRPLLVGGKASMEERKS